MRRRWILIVAAMAGGNAAPPSPLDAAGQVLQVSGAPEDGVVRREAGREVLAVPYLLLFPGDIVVAKRDSTVLVQAAGRGTIRVTTATGPLQMIADRTGVVDAARHFFQRWNLFFTRAPRPIIVHTMTRAGQAGTPARPPFLRSKVQNIPSDARHLAVYWTEASATAVLRMRGAQTQTVPASETSAAGFAISTLSPGTLSVGAGPSELVWTIRPVDRSAVPSPPWISDDPEAARSRTVRAAWLLAEGPPEWHLFAVTELEELSATDAVAARLWRVARSGEWSIGQ